MTQTLAVDYSFSRPSPATIKSHGYTAVGRYLGGSSGKRITRDEATSLHAAGLGIWLVWETSADRARSGNAGGVSDAHAAAAAALAVGYPTSCPLFFAVDFDATPAQVSAYFAGIRSVLGNRAGIYGGIKVTEAGLAHWRWQTAAWSGGKVDPAAHLYQRTKMTHPIGGCDENVICHPIPLWTAAGVSKPAEKPAKEKPAATKKKAAKKPEHPAAVQDEIKDLKDLQHKQEASGHPQRAEHTKDAKKALKQEKNQ